MSSAIAARSCRTDDIAGPLEAFNRTLRPLDRILLLGKGYLRFLVALGVFLSHLLGDNARMRIQQVLVRRVGIKHLVKFFWVYPAASCTLAMLAMLAIDVEMLLH